MDWKPQPRPQWVEEVNRSLRECGWPEAGFPSMEKEALLDEASRRRGGLNDFGEPDYVEALDKLLWSVQHEANLNPVGLMITRDEIVNALECRLWLEDLYRRHPEIDDEVIEKPVFVCGMGRSGTSIVHESLAAASCYQSLSSWEMRSPWAYEMPDDLAEAEKDKAWQAVAHNWYGPAPELEAMHQMGRDMAQECAWVLIYSFCADYFGNAVLNVPGYQQWMMGSDKIYSYQYYRRYLKAIQWLRGDEAKGKRWVLKTPTHNFHIDTIRSVFPDAKIVWTHRDPIKTLASGVNMRATLAYSRSDQVFNVKELAAMALAGLPMLFQWATQLDERSPENQMAHLRYADFMASPESALREMLEKLELSSDQATLDACMTYLKSRPQHSKGVNRYSVDILGIDDMASAKASFDHYIKYFNVPWEVIG